MSGILLLAVCTMLIPGTIATAATAPDNAVTVVMKDFTFDPPRVQLRVGDALTLTLRNEGKVAHEWLIGRRPVRNADEKGYQQDLFALLHPTSRGANTAWSRSVGAHPALTSRRRVVAWAWRFNRAAK